MGKKPTIHELENILKETDPGQAHINPDGSVVVGPSYSELQERIADLEQLLKYSCGKILIEKGTGEDWESRLKAALEYEQKDG